MLVLILIAVWIAILAPVAVRRLRDRDTDRSILSFHERMAKLGDRGQPIVEPAHRLETRPATVAGTAAQSYSDPEPYVAPTGLPRLRIVPDGATTADLNRDMSWDEWSNQFLDEPEPVAPTASEAPYQRAAAYSHVPSAPPLTSRTPVTTVRAQRVRRRQVLLSILGTAVVSTLMALIVGFWLIEFVAFASWFGLLIYLGLMYYAMSIGMIESSPRARGVRLVNPRTTARTVDVETRRPYEDVVYNEFDDAYESQPSTQFQYVSDDDDRYARAL